MASPAEPVTTEPTGALFRALRSVDVEPNLAYEAAEENRRRAGESVVAVLGAKIDAQGARIKAHRRSTACDLAADRFCWPSPSSACSTGFSLPPLVKERSSPVGLFGWV